MSRRLFVAGALVVFAGCGLVTGLDDYEIDGADVAALDAGDAARPDVVVVGRDAQTDSGDGGSIATPDADAPNADAGSDAADAGPMTCDEPGLIARWTFDEPSGAVVRDCTSHRYDGTLGAGAVRGAGRSAGGVAMAAGIVTFGAPSAFDLTAALTICAWSRVNAFPSDPVMAGYVAAKSKEVGTDGWRLGVDATHGLTFAVARGNGTYVELFGGAFAPGSWLHACGVFRPGKVELYVNGVLKSSDITASAAILNSTSAFSVGNRADGTRPFNGAIDDVRLYNRALSAAEVGQIAK